MDRELHEESNDVAVEEFVNRLKELGRASGRKFLRAVFYEDGRGELEFEAKNAWECLVVASDDWERLFNVLGQTRRGGNLFEDAVIRKKCTKCFLHQRAIGSSDL